MLVPLTAKRKVLPTLLNFLQLGDYKTADVNGNLIT